MATGLTTARAKISTTGELVLAVTPAVVSSQLRTNTKSRCVGITIAPKIGKFFWTQKGSSKATQGRIFSANIDMPPGENASNRSDIQTVMDALPEPIDLEFDEASEVLYWTDRGELPLGNTLNKKHLPGGSSDGGGLGKGQEILAQGFGETIGLKIDYGQHVAYVADLGGRLWKVSLIDGEKDVLKQR